MFIYREHLAAYRKDAAELVLLHGWASDSSVWALRGRWRRCLGLCMSPPSMILI